jgi:hypothetical protein
MSTGLNATRRYDGYLASDGEIEIARVVFIGSNRMVVKERFASREAWNAERCLKRKSDKEKRIIGNINEAALNGPTPDDPLADGTPEPPADCIHYYGLDWLP